MAPCVACSLCDAPPEAPPQTSAPVPEMAPSDINVDNDAKQAARPPREAQQCQSLAGSTSRPAKAAQQGSAADDKLAALASAVAAAKLGLVDQLSQALTTSSSVAFARDAEDRTCLHYAAGYGHEACVELLLEHNADARARDANGDLPLHFAAIHGHPMCAYNITKACPSTCLTRNVRGQTPVEVAVACERGEVLNAMLLACAGDGTGGVTVQAMRKLLSSGAVPDTWAPNGSSALMLAAAANGTDALGVLLEAGATLELQDALGRSALMFAAGNCARETLLALLDAGACISQRDRRGRNVLDYAPAGSEVRKVLQARLDELEAVANKLQQDLLDSLLSREAAATGPGAGVEAKAQAGGKKKKGAAAKKAAPAAAAATQADTAAPAPAAAACAGAAGKTKGAAARAASASCADAAAEEAEHARPQATPTRAPSCAESLPRPVAGSSCRAEQHALSVTLVSTPAVVDAAIAAGRDGSWQVVASHKCSIRSGPTRSAAAIAGSVPTAGTVLLAQQRPAGLKAPPAQYAGAARVAIAVAAAGGPASHVDVHALGPRAHTASTLVVAAADVRPGAQTVRRSAGATGQQPKPSASSATTPAPPAPGAAHRQPHAADAPVSSTAASALGTGSCCFKAALVGGDAAGATTTAAPAAAAGGAARAEERQGTAAASGSALPSSSSSGSERKPAWGGARLCAQAAPPSASTGFAPTDSAGDASTFPPLSAAAASHAPTPANQRPSRDPLPQQQQQQEQRQDAPWPSHTAALSCADSCSAAAVSAPPSIGDSDASSTGHSTCTTLAAGATSPKSFGHHDWTRPSPVDALQAALASAAAAAAAKQQLAQGDEGDGSGDRGGAAAEAEARPGHSKTSSSGSSGQLSYDGGVMHHERLSALDAMLAAPPPPRPLVRPSGSGAGAAAGAAAAAAAAAAGPTRIGSLDLLGGTEVPAPTRGACSSALDLLGRHHLHNPASSVAAAAAAGEAAACGVAVGSPGQVVACGRGSEWAAAAGLPQGEPAAGSLRAGQGHSSSSSGGAGRAGGPGGASVGSGPSSSSRGSGSGSGSSMPDVARLKAENEAMQRRLRKAEQRHNHELAAVLMDAEQHEQLAVERALAQERLRITANLIAIGLCPEAILAVITPPAHAADAHHIAAAALSAGTPAPPVATPDRSAAAASSAGRAPDGAPAAARAQSGGSGGGKPPMGVASSGGAQQQQQRQAARGGGGVAAAGRSGGGGALRAVRTSTGSCAEPSNEPTTTATVASGGSTASQSSLALMLPSSPFSPQRTLPSAAIAIPTAPAASSAASAAAPSASAAAAAFASSFDRAAAFLPPSAASFGSGAGGFLSASVGSRGLLVGSLCGGLGLACMSTASQGCMAAAEDVGAGGEDDGDLLLDLPACGGIDALLDCWSDDES